MNLPEEIRSVKLLKEEQVIEVDNCLRIKFRNPKHFELIWFVAKNGDLSQRGVTEEQIKKHLQDIPGALTQYWLHNTCLGRAKVSNVYNISELPNKKEVTKQIEDDIKKECYDFANFLKNHLFPREEAIPVSGIYSRRKTYSVAPDAKKEFLPGSAQPYSWETASSVSTPKQFEGKFKQPEYEKLVLTQLRQVMSEFLGDRTVEIIDGIKGSPYELKKLLKIATKSVLILGQNLHTPVKDEIKAAKKGINKKGSYRNKLRKWLLEEPGKRHVKIVIVDPSSKAAVLHYAQIFGENFIPDLCEAVPRYQEWVKDMGSIGFEARVAQDVPLSLQAIDAQLQNSDTALMTVPQIAGEARPGIRPTTIIRRQVHEIAFQRLYRKCRRYFSPKFTKRITEVTKEDLTECRKWIDEL